MMSRRYRETNACRECRRRKVKCDTARPACAKCRERHVECVYTIFADDPPIQPSLPESSGFLTPQSTGNLLVPTTRQQDHSVDAGVGVSTTPFGQDVTLNRLDSNQSVPAPELETEETIHKRAREHGDQSPIEQEPGGNIGYLNIEGGGRTRYVAGNYWACVSSEPEPIDRLLRSQKKYYNDESLPRHSSTQSASASPQLGSENHPVNFGAQNAPASRVGTYQGPSTWNFEASNSSKFQSRAVIDTDMFPTRAQADCLMHAFIRNYQAIIPLVHVPNFLHAYDGFWVAGGVEAPKTHPSPSFISLLYAVLLAGSVVVLDQEWSNAFPEQSRDNVSQDLYAQTRQALRRASYIRAPTIDSFTAYLISDSIWLRDEEPLKCCSFIGVAVRVAQILGLNRDPSHFPAIPPVTAEIRRRVWWYMFHLDVQVSLAAGLPPLIETTSWDVRPISELKDRYIGTSEAAEYKNALASDLKHPIPNNHEQINATSLVSTSGLYAAGKYKDTMNSKLLLVKLFQQGPKTRGDVAQVRFEIEQLRSNLMARIRRIPLETDSLNISQDDQRETYAYHPDLNRWARLVLAALCDKTWGFLYHPLVHTAISRVWAPLRSSILYHSKEFVKKSVYLTINPAFKSFHWTWPGQHQPLHALMILIREIDTNADLPSAEEYRETVDEAFALCGPDGGLVGTDEPDLHHRTLTEAGREAWDLLRNLRARAWQKHGVDPDVLWTREQVAERAHANAAAILQDPDAEFPRGEISDQQASLFNEGRSDSLHTALPPAGEPMPPTTVTQNAFPEGATMTDIDWNEWDSLVAGSQTDLPGFLGFGTSSDQ